MNMIKVNEISIYDGLICTKESSDWYQYILQNGNFRYGEQDREDSTPVGMTIDLSEKDILFNRFCEILIKNNLVDNGAHFLRAYINLFLPNDRPYFHQDGDVVTFLFYLNPEVNMDEGGETQFVIDDEIRGLLPVSGRLVKFDGKILHRATSFRTIPRITLAMKLKNTNT